MPTIAHISDLHLQSSVPERQVQVEPILQKINEMKPDLVVISGDVTDDGWDSIEELKWAKAWLEERIDSEWFAVPGNHDVGNFISLREGPINAERVNYWEQVFGKSSVIEIENLLVIGLNSMLFGSGLSAEKKQIDRLSELIDTHSGQIALFLHSPLFVDHIDDDPDDPAVDYWLGPKAPRIEILNIIQRESIKYLLIGSGHVHQTYRSWLQWQFAWAPPASGTWVHAKGLRNPPMPEQTGFWLHRFTTESGFTSELIECAPMLKLYEHNPWP